MSSSPKKVPVILQMEAMECGAACLAMILAYYRKWVPLDQVRQDCGVSREGSNALSICKAAESYGLKYEADRFSVKHLKAEGVRLPAIIWWKYSHFVVLDGFTGEMAVINDPAKGVDKMPIEEFARSYSGLCLQFEPTEEFQPGGKPPSVLEFLRSRIKDNRSALVLVAMTGVLSIAGGVFAPVFSRVFTDEILAEGHTAWLPPFLALFGALILFRLIADALNNIAVRRATGKIAVTTNTQFMWHILRIPIQFFENRLAGDLANRKKSNDKAAKTLIGRLAPVMMNMVLLVLYLVVMIHYSAPLTAIGVCTIVLNSFLAWYISRKRVGIARSQVRDQGKLQATTASCVDMIESIKASGAENGYFERWSGYHASVVSSKTDFSQTNRYLEPLAGLIQSISDILILAIGVWLIMRQQFTAGLLLAFQSFMVSFLAPVNKVIAAGQSVQELQADMERIDDVMKFPADVPETLDPHEADGLKDAQKLSGDVSLDHVTFGYAKYSKPVIEDFSLHLKAGSRVALVGGSGSGKSTIIKLLAGLYKPWEGEIRFDGKLISEIPRPVFTGSLAMVDQDVVLYEDTIRNNITMWDETIENYEVILAAREAGMHEDILARKDGYKHRLSEGGRNLSGGQRQRIEIARALAADPSILIMDEATSALDAKTEYEVSEAIRARSITCLIVAHRLSTIRDCDEIIVLDKGKIVERGTHDALMKNDGLYRKLVITE
ncbi:MAG: NHLP family bacteriocin export ABC transporter peptidase/permease/ATPase subunit [Clostridia bacterium]|nr:NHLP family bacteriocin export ABC transporter peptidase/permease/ATPase subunit [Clostridia bacterium]